MDADKRGLPTSWRRFSLREILLATTAIAALVALFQQSNKGQATEFIRTLDVEKLIENIGKQEGLTLGQLRLTGGQGSGASDHVANLDATYSFSYLADPNDLCAKTMPALRDEMRDRLAKDGCVQAGEGMTGRKQMTELARWAYGYKRGRLRGKFRAYTSFTEDGDPELRITIDEW